VGDQGLLLEGINVTPYILERSRGAPRKTTKKGWLKKRVCKADARTYVASVAKKKNS